MRVAAGEAIPFQVRLADPAGVPESLAGRIFVFAIYRPNRSEVGYHVGTLTDDNFNVRWILDGTHSEALYTEGSLLFEVAEAIDNSRERITNGTLTIEMSAPRIDDFDQAPVTRYLTTVERRATPATTAFVVTVDKYTAPIVIVPAPMNTVAPTISGTATVGQSLTAADGSWTGSPSLSRQWLRNGVAIGGATGNTYTVNAADASSTISVRVTATNAGGSATATSNTLSVPAAPVFSSNPSISPASGMTGTTFTGSATATNTTSYTRSWKLDAIEIGTSTTVTPQAAGSLTLTVVATGPGGSSTSTSSAVTVTANPASNPANLSAPFISGTPMDGTAWTFNLGEWSSSAAITGFDIEVVSTDATPVVFLSRQAVTADTSSSISGTVGKSLVLKVWAKTLTGETLASSAAFGPITAAGDQLILAAAWSTTAQDLPSSPYPWTRMTTLGGSDNTTKNMAVFQGATQLAATGLYPITNPNVANTSFGFAGTSDASGTTTISSGGFADSRLQGRLGNLSYSQNNFRIDLPGPGVYRVYAGLGVSGTQTNVSLEVWNGAPGVGATNSVHVLNNIADPNDSASVLDIMGNTITVADWSSTLGAFKEVTVTEAAPYLTIAKGSFSDSVASQLNCVAVFKKAS